MKKGIMVSVCVLALASTISTTFAEQTIAEAFEGLFQPVKDAFRTKYIVQEKIKDDNYIISVELKDFSTNPTNSSLNNSNISSKFPIKK